MYANLLGIFLFATFINYSLQLKCYDCKSQSQVSTASSSLKQNPLAGTPAVACPDPLTDDVTKDCSGDCGKYDVTIMNTRTIVRSCAEVIDCRVQGELADTWNGTLNYCGTCDKDKCNSGFRSLGSTSFLAICISFIAFRAMFS